MQAGYKSVQLCRGLRDPQFASVLGEQAAQVIEALQVALEFYANPGNYRSSLRNLDHNIYIDQGKKANETLQSIAVVDASIQFGINGFASQ